VVLSPPRRQASRCAENPPKRYEDILPDNFECDDWQNLWHELKSIFRFLDSHGVTIFRVDNPHTKRMPSGNGDCGSEGKRIPDTIFLAEAFARPKVMKYLSKI